MGKQITITVFGESHAPAVGMTLCGVPAGERIDFEALAAFMRRRAPGKDAISTARREADIPEFLCGVVDGVTTGAPITAIIRNSDTRSSDYKGFSQTPRPSHADYTATVKYGGKSDMRGGGHFSGRLTAPLCIGGGVALQILARRGIKIGAHALRIADVSDTPFDLAKVDESTLDALAARDFPTLSPAAGEKMTGEILAAKREGDSVGGVIECAVLGMPAGFGAPMFDGIENRLAAALCGAAGVPESCTASRLPQGAACALAEWCAAAPLRVADTEGFRACMATRGGVSTGELDRTTLECRRIRGLYVAGEAAEPVGPCGGYNLAWAWASGYAAAFAIRGAPKT